MKSESRYPPHDKIYKQLLTCDKRALGMSESLCAAERIGHNLFNYPSENFRLPSSIASSTSGYPQHLHPTLTPSNPGWAMQAVSLGNQSVSESTVTPHHGYPTYPAGYATYHGVHQTPTSSSQGIYQCPHCSAQFDRLGRFEAHLNVHNDTRPYSCDGSCGTMSW